MRPKLALIIFAIFLVFTPIVSAQVLPDLIVDSVGVSNTNPKSGEMIDINIGIKNIGTNTSPLFNYELYLTDQKFGERKVSLNWNYNKLEVDKVYRTTLQAGIFGPSTIRIVVDNENTVAELNDSNNEKIIKVGFEEAAPEQILPGPIVNSTSQPQTSQRGFRWPKLPFTQTTFSEGDPLITAGLSLAVFVVITAIIYGIMRIFNRKETSEEKEK